MNEIAFGFDVFRKGITLEQTFESVPGGG